MTTDVAALQELAPQESSSAQGQVVCCWTWTAPGCGAQTLVST
ncbi:hypothetical protein ABZ860_38155 [Microbispora sp. NPDC046973]